ncbi:copper resistance CopC/CopD family protein [Streptomyces sp. B3I7]|uniref:copper resistance CopC/CopD family protein n=1 Tax=Streptomyces sp. B3I7 TaxID=3042269 RepID=UPI0027D8A451|nr:copper resistance protein CopC [Streptomyces sp. B3I7]
MRALLPLFALLLAAGGLLLGSASPASAHAALTGSAPAQGAVVDKAPSEVTLTFSEKISLPSGGSGSLRVLNPAGKQVDTGKPSNLQGTTYGIPLRSGLPDGTYTVTFQVISADSHPVAGGFTFSIGAPSATSVSVSDQAVGGGVVGALYGFARYVSYAGFVVLIGGATFVLACWQRGAGERTMQRFVVSGWIALTGATLALLLLRGSYTGSGKVADIFDLSLVGQVLQSKTGAALLSRLLLLAAAALFVAVLFGAYARQDDEDGDTGKGTEGAKDAAGTEDGEDAADRAAERRDLTFGLAVGGAVIAAGLAATWAMAEHASTGIQTSIAMPVDILHLLAVATWLGGLAALLTALYRTPSIEATAVQRFSRVAFGSVVVLVASGLYQSWRQVGSWSALTGTAYGQLLLAKVALVAVLLGIARFSHRWTAHLADVPATTKKEKEKEKEKRKKTVAAVTSASASASSGKASSGRTGSGKPSTGSDDPRRAAQLARQRAATAAARAKRVREADPFRSGLRRSVLAEAGVAVVLLAVTTVLTTTEPGRTEEEAQAAKAAASSSSSSSSSSSDAQTSESLSLELPFDTGGEDGKGTARVTLDPARVGGNVMHVYVTRPNGRTFDVPEVKVSFTLAAKDIGPLPVNPDRVATGHWSASSVQIPLAGNWKVAVTVRTSDIDQVTVDKNAQIG